MRLVQYVLRIIEKGNCIKVGNLELICLHPYDGFATDEANDYSTVLSLHYKDFSMLFTGDVSNEGEKALIENEELGHHTVYKVAHHGSKYTNNIELLEKISPKYAIISAGKNNERTTKGQRKRYKHKCRNPLK